MASWDVWRFPVRRASWPDRKAHVTSDGATDLLLPIHHTRLNKLLHVLGWIIYQYLKSTSKRIKCLLIFTTYACVQFKILLTQPRFVRTRRSGCCKVCVCVIIYWCTYLYIKGSSLWFQAVICTGCRSYLALEGFLTDELKYSSHYLEDVFLSPRWLFNDRRSIERKMRF